jgi:DNA-binding transcriptional ArsR family regulator
MSIFSRRSVSVAMIASALSAATLFSSAQSKATLSDLVQRLKAEQTSSEATEQLLKLGKTDPRARAYLADHLPAIIETGPQRSLPSWSNAVKLAGELKIVEAAPALSRWISVLTGNGVVSLGEQLQLTNSPAGTALVSIGEPAIPALRTTLQQGDMQDRWRAACALNVIGSVKAKTVLREHLAHEPDATLRDFIEKSTSK